MKRVVFFAAVLMYAGREKLWSPAALENTRVEDMAQQRQARALRLLLASESSSTDSLDTLLTGSLL